MNYKIATITLNPAYDLVGFCPSIEIGEVNLVKTMGLHPAGKGINVAKVLSDLGIDVTVAGLLGKENSEPFFKFFEKNGINNEFQTVDGVTRTNLKLTEKSGSVTDLNFSGFTVSAICWQKFVDRTLNLFKHFDIISVSGSLPNGVSPSAFGSWLKKLIDVCPRVVLDTSREALTAGLEANPWLIKPNDQELSIWAGKPLHALDEMITAAKEIVSKGIENVIVSLGSRGAIWVTNKTIWLAKPPVRPVVSTVGAGDSLVAGLMYGLLKKKSTKETLQFASAIAAFSVSQTTVGIADENVLSSLIDKISLIAIE